jgi:hypothetical protein
LSGFQWIECATRVAIVAAALGCGPVLSVAEAATAGYDGVYRGTTTLDRGDESVCGKTTHPTSVTLVNGQFSIVWDPSHNVGINLQVQNDGSFSSSQAYTVGKRTGQLMASGHVAGNVLDAHLEGQYCSRNYHLTKG